jgi:hypothetical protein
VSNIKKKKLKLSDRARGRRHLKINKKERADTLSKLLKWERYNSMSLGSGVKKWFPQSVIDSTILCGTTLKWYN